MIHVLLIKQYIVNRKDNAIPLIQTHFQVTFDNLHSLYLYLETFRKHRDKAAADDDG